MYDTLLYHLMKRWVSGSMKIVCNVYACATCIKVTIQVECKSEFFVFWSAVAINTTMSSTTQSLSEVLQQSVQWCHPQHSLIWGFFYIHFYFTLFREQDEAYSNSLWLVDTGGTRTCIHPHVSRPLYHCATDMICKHRKKVLMHYTKCPYWDQVSLNNTKIKLNFLQHALIHYGSHWTK